MHATHRQDLQSVSHLAPRRLNTFIHTGWIDSVITGRPINSHGQPIPWFTYPSIDFLEPRIDPSWSVLEWGCGNSTHWWAARTKKVVGIEHNPQWFEKISTDLPSNASIQLVEEPADYASLGSLKCDELFDVLVIDGVERNACARVACDRAKRGSIIIFDISDRQSNRDGLLFLMSAGWKRIDFFGLIPSYAYRTCTSIFYRDELLVGLQPLPCDINSSLGQTLSQVLGE